MTTTGGRKRVPTALKLIRGNPGRRPVNTNEPKPAKTPPPAPAHLDARARAEWDRLVPELFAAGLLTSIDGAALAAYCNAFSRWAEAEEALAKMRARDELTSALMIKTKSGNAIQNPLVGTSNRAMLLMCRFAAEFGMTPAARARLAALPYESHPNDDRKESYF
ncbi:P27 family predicted phage terminase small subunit [Paraburkholderia sp. WSM4175]|uniref:phage terminase small subunit P27 family n=1 Tax=Paraburkholderia sp. WSM4175 TaxID=2991072 RepID=UPI003D25D2B2